MSTRIQLNGPARYRMRTTAVLCHSALDVCWRRTLKGPRRPDWNWAVELGTEALKAQLAAAFAMPDVTEARRYLDAVVLRSTALAEVHITPSSKTVRAPGLSPSKGRREPRYFIFMVAVTPSTLKVTPV